MLWDRRTIPAHTAESSAVVTAGCIFYFSGFRDGIIVNDEQFVRVSNFGRV